MIGLCMVTHGSFIGRFQQASRLMVRLIPDHTINCRCGCLSTATSGSGCVHGQRSWTLLLPISSSGRRELATTQLQGGSTIAPLQMSHVQSASSVLWRSSHLVAALGQTGLEESAVVVSLWRFRHQVRGGVLRGGTTVKVVALAPVAAAQAAVLTPWVPSLVALAAGEPPVASSPVVPLGCRDMTTGVKFSVFLSRRGTAPVGVPVEAAHAAVESALGVGSKGRTSTSALLGTSWWSTSHSGSFCRG